MLPFRCCAFRRLPCDSFSARFFSIHFDSVAYPVFAIPFLSLSSLLLFASLRIPAYLFRIGAFLVIAIHCYSVSARILATPRFAVSKRSQSTPSPFNRSVPIPLLCFSSLCSSVSVRFSLLLRSSVSTPVYTIPLPCVSFLCSSLSFHGLAIQFHCLSTHSSTILFHFRPFLVCAIHFPFGSLYFFPSVAPLAGASPLSHACEFAIIKPFTDC